LLFYGLFPIAGQAYGIWRVAARYGEFGGECFGCVPMGSAETWIHRDKCRSATSRAHLPGARGPRCDWTAVIAAKSTSLCHPWARFRGATEFFAESVQWVGV
jgi:hypothetical protein